MIVSMFANKEIKPAGGKQTREFNYVDNIIDGLLFLNKKIQNSIDPINIGGNVNIHQEVSQKNS